MSLGDILNQGGHAFQQLFASEGASAEANSYSSAAQLATQNAQLTAASTKIQETQLARQVFQTEGTQVADVAGAGFTESGSALDLLRSSAQQGALAKSLTNIQGAINENSYAAQAGAYEGAAKAAGENASAGVVGAIASIGGALVDNTGTLASAGKTVASGVNYISNSIENLGTTDYTSAIGPSLSGDPMESSLLDQQIASGSDLSESIASSGIGVDTSEIPIGTSEDAVSEGITDSLSGIGEELSVSGSDIASGVGDAISSSAADIGSSVADAAGGIGDVLETVGETIGEIIASVICTAFKDREIISKPVWWATSQFRSKVSQSTYRGYLLWGCPIALLIMRSGFWARILTPIFAPVIEAIAARIGLDIKTSIYGRTTLKVMLGFSWCLGKLIIVNERMFHDTASNTR